MHIIIIIWCILYIGTTYIILQSRQFPQLIIIMCCYNYYNFFFLLEFCYFYRNSVLYRPVAAVIVLFKSGSGRNYTHDAMYNCEGFPTGFHDYWNIVAFGPRPLYTQLSSRSTYIVRVPVIYCDYYILFLLLFLHNNSVVPTSYSSHSSSL